MGPHLHASAGANMVRNVLDAFRTVQADGFDEEFVFFVGPGCFDLLAAARGTPAGPTRPRLRVLFGLRGDRHFTNDVLCAL